MFRENHNHNQQSLLDSTQWMNPRIREKLKKSWAPIFMVNYALGIKTLGDLNLAEPTLNHFQERVYQYCIENPEKEDLLFGQFIRLLESFAAHAGISLEQQRTDTTLFMSNIKKAGRMSLTYDVLVKAVKAIPEAKRTEALSQVLEHYFQDGYPLSLKGSESR
ncbi:hypothetical protein [Lutispora saccharofermentans]|uniref:Uncharacterized protein n=1 Tax=Lutispora saccharofermentans TaxID=3024236 RepID=A0ABT1NJ83_9FIRM|nr:hypothetical protein [Lutispora saccharofermentans]MCQ1531283.1 hypothetical protein [Lutispora saccharofermentans]